MTIKIEAFPLIVLLMVAINEHLWCTQNIVICIVRCDKGDLQECGGRDVTYRIDVTNRSLNRPNEQRENIIWPELSVYANTFPLNMWRGV